VDMLAIRIEGSDHLETIVFLNLGSSNDGNYVGEFVFYACYC
jgi:hypothetical protein